MKAKCLALVFVLGGWLVSSPVVLAAVEYAVFDVSPYNLQDRINDAAKQGWRLKSVINYVGCPGVKEKCLMVVMERE